MDSIPIQGHIDSEYRLSVEVPASIPPGPVTVWVQAGAPQEDAAGLAWMAGVAREWAASRQVSLLK